jgi:hypothetical protein
MNLLTAERLLVFEGPYPLKLLLLLLLLLLPLLILYHHHIPTVSNSVTYPDFVTLSVY